MLRLLRHRYSVCAMCTWDWWVVGRVLVGVRAISGLTLDGVGIGWARVVLLHGGIGVRHDGVGRMRVR